MRMIPRFGVVTAAVALATGTMIPSAIGDTADTTIVVHPGDSIQSAVDSAHPGDTIVVEAGTYHQNVVIQTNGITLKTDGKVTLKPSSTPGLCDDPEDQMGICVVPADIDPSTGAYTNRVKNVKITGFRIKDFTGFGIFGYGTQNLKIWGVRAIDNGVYGIARFDGIGGYIKHSWATGSDEAGIYVGDSPEAHARVEDNKSWNNGIGVFVRHVHFATVKENVTRHNCIGIFLLDDGQPEGSGNTRVVENRVDENNKFCPGDAEEGIPPTSGGGIVLLGSHDNVIRDNRITDNHKVGTLVSGGLVLITSPFSNLGSNNNQVRHNYLNDNQPFDVIQDSGSTGNTFTNNTCDTSSPSGIC